MGVLLGIAFVVMGVLVVMWVRRSHRDEVFAGLTPGLLPAPGQVVRRVRVDGRERGPIAVRFTPPDGVSPGLAGTVLDNTVNPVDISATLIDLAVRGWFRLKPLDGDQQPATPERRAKRTAKDWELRRRDPAPADVLSPAERQVIGGLFARGPVITLSEVRRSHGAVLRQAVVELYRETVDRGWFAAHPRGRAKGWWTAGGVLVVLGLLGMVVSFWAGDAWVAGLGLAIAGGVLIVGTQALRTPTTAEGSAVRAQTEGFRLYLGTAEAGQLAADAAADVYTRYLPYAMVFGVVAHWNAVFAQALRDSGTPGDLAAQFSWIDLPLGMLDVLASGVDLGGDAAGLLDGVDLDAGGILDGLGDLTDGTAGFADSIGDLLGGLGDGCDLADGCGCDF
ncbi:MAG: DUF2207 domain-containing protein [Propionicimonas sp.]|uniref:DUF2207 family protein n=1 Tax=Propionicimonas sp. TaxID=1955623 RepID=UPI003D1442EB